MQKCERGNVEDETDRQLKILQIHSRDRNKRLTVKLLCVRGFHDGAAGHPAAIIYTHKHTHASGLLVRENTLKYILGNLKTARTALMKSRTCEAVGLGDLTESRAIS